MNPTTPCLLPGLVLLACLAHPVSAQAQARYSYSSDGAEVVDARTGLVWRRCTEGQSWSGGTCAGSASVLTHQQALALAETQTGWRLPNVKELASLVDRSRYGAAIDPAAFPATRADAYWSSTPTVFNDGCPQGVNFYEGNISCVSYSGGTFVRLVRR